MLLSLTFIYQSLVLKLFQDDLFLFELKFSVISLLLFLAFGFFIDFFFVIQMPRLLDLGILSQNPILSRLLLILHILQHLTSIVLLYLLGHLHVMLKTSLVCHFSLPLFQFKNILSHDKFFVIFLDNFFELVKLFIELLLLNFASTLSNLVHPVVRISGLLDFLTHVPLLGICACFLLLLYFFNHLLHLSFMVLLSLKF